MVITRAVSSGGPVATLTTVTTQIQAQVRAVYEGFARSYLCWDGHDFNGDRCRRCNITFAQMAESEIATLLYDSKQFDDEPDETGYYHRVLRPEDW